MKKAARKIGKATVISTKRTKLKKESPLELGFLRAWMMHGKGPQPVREFKFHPVREWRFDFAWPHKLVAVEIHGGTHGRGRHVTGKGFHGDCQKQNAAVRRGWRVLAFTTEDVN